MRSAGSALSGAVNREVSRSCSHSSCLPGGELVLFCLPGGQLLLLSVELFTGRQQYLSLLSLELFTERSAGPAPTFSGVVYREVSRSCSHWGCLPGGQWSCSVYREVSCFCSQWSCLPGGQQVLLLLSVELFTVRSAGPALLSAELFTVRSAGPAPALSGAVYREVCPVHGDGDAGELCRPLKHRLLVQQQRVRVTRHAHVQTRSCTQATPLVGLQ